MPMLRPTDEMKESGDKYIGQIPDNWRMAKYKYFAQSGMGQTILKTDTSDKGVPIYSATQDASIFGYLQAPNLVLHYGDIVIPARGNSIGFPTFINDDLATCTQTTIYSKIKGINPKFLYYCCIGLKDEWFYYVQTAIPQITVTQVQNNSVPLPPLAEQQAIADYLDDRCSKIDEIIAEATASIEEYKELKQAVIFETVTKGLDKTVPMKDSGVECIGSIPCEWHICKVKNIASYVSDGAHVSPDTDNGEYCFISTVNLKNGVLDFENCLQTSKESYYQLMRNGCRPQKNDVLISKDGTVGKTAVVDYDREFVVASSLVIIRPILSVMNPYYLQYNLRSNFVQERLQLLMHGAGLKRVSVAKNANLPVIVPSLEEQNAIVRYLDKKIKAIDSLISEKQALIEDLQAYKKSLIYEVVTGKRRVV